jgi:hypothetical protein
MHILILGKEITNFVTQGPSCKADTEAIKKFSAIKGQ